MRLIDQEKIDIIVGDYASSHAVPLAAKVEQQKKILWITTAVSTAVFKDKNLQYVFRAQFIPINTARPSPALSPNMPRRNSAWSPRTSRSR